MAIGSLTVALGIDFQPFISGIKDMEREAKAATKAWKPLTDGLDDIGATFKSAGQTLSLGLTAPIVAFGAIAVKQFGESAEALSLLNAVIQSTGGAAGKSADDVQKLATSLQNSSLFEDDEIIRKVLNQLLTFTNISGKSFDDAAQATLNLSEALHEDLQSAAIQVGKALNDPIAGVTALRRVGVQLSDDQKEQVKSFMAVNDIASAQGVILTELQKEFGGAAAAAASAGTGPFKQLQIAMGNLSEAFGGLIVDGLKPMAGYLTDAVRYIDGLSTSTKEAILIVAGLAAAIGPVLIVLGTMATGLSSIITIVGSVSAVLGTAGLTGALATVAAVITGPVGIVIAIGAAVAAIAYFVDQTEVGHQLITETWNAIKELAAVVWNGISQIVKDAADAITELWDQNKDSLLEIWNTLKEAAAAIWAVIGDDVKEMAHILIDVIGGALLTLKDSWGASFGELKVITSTVWDLIKGLITGSLDAIKGVMEIFTGVLTMNWSKFSQGISDIWTGLWTTIKAVVTAPIELIKGTVANFTDSVTGYFSDMYDAVVGHSYVPDMISGIGGEFGKLDGNMVQPALRAAQQTTGVFQQMGDDFSRALQNMDSQLASSFASMVVHGKFSMDSLKSIAEDTAQSMLTSFMKGLMTPLTDQLATLGKSLGNTISQFLNIGSNAGDATKALPAGVAGPVLAGGGTAGGTLSAIGGALTSTAGLATMGIGAAALAITAWVKSQAHWEANDLTSHMQGPFDQQWAALFDQVTQNQDSMSAADVHTIRDSLFSSWSDILATVDTWSQGSKDKQQAAVGFYNTEIPIRQQQFAYLDSLFNQKMATESGVPALAGGSPMITKEGLFLLHPGEAVLTKEQNPNAGGMGGASLHIDSITVNVNGGTDGQSTSASIAAAVRSALMFNHNDIRNVIQRASRVAI